MGRNSAQDVEVVGPRRRSFQVPNYLYSMQPPSTTPWPIVSSIHWFKYLYVGERSFCQDFEVFVVRLERQGGIWLMEADY